MTQYRLKKLDGLEEKRTAWQIQYILCVSNREMTKREIYKKGKDVFKEDFPKDKNTILRYLNSMYEKKQVGKVYTRKGQSSLWYCKEKEKIHLPEIVANIDIEKINEHVGHESPYFFIKGLHVLPDMSVYGISPFIKVYFPHELDSIINSFREDLTKLVLLQIKSIMVSIAERFFDILKNQNEGFVLIASSIFFSIIEKNYLKMDDNSLHYQSYFYKEKEYYKINDIHILEIKKLLKKNMYPKGVPSHLLDTIRNYRIEEKQYFSLVSVIDHLRTFVLDYLRNPTCLFPMLIINPQRDPGKEFTPTVRGLSNDIIDDLHRKLIKEQKKVFKKISELLPQEEKKLTKWFEDRG